MFYIGKKSEIKEIHMGFNCQILHVHLVKILIKKKERKTCMLIHVRKKTE